ncbi:MAG: PhzF family phenazine biosynthesis protein, partial [Acidimicrobiales bacterium]
LGTPEVRGAWEGGGWALVEAASPQDVEAAAPDRALVMALGGHVVLVADDASERRSGYDSVCRTFVPAAGIDEDPVTGSAHCAIGPWLAERTGRRTFRCLQASARRGEMDVEVAADRVTLTGHAVAVHRGELLAVAR